MIMSGWNKIQGKLVTWILENEPLGTFSIIPNQIDFGVAYGTIDAIDYNNDGLKDFVIAGADSVTNHAGSIHSLSGRVYLNNGNGTFSPIKEIPGARTIRFADINLDDIPEMIKNNFRNEDKNTDLMKFLRLPEFANLMRTDNKPVSKTYSAKPTLQPSTAKHEGEILSKTTPILEKPASSSSTKITQKINQNTSPSVSNRTI